MKRIAIGVVLAIVSSAAIAQPYASAGVSHVKVEGQGQEALAVSAGYRFGKHLALEIGAFQPGRVTESTNTIYTGTQQEFTRQDRDLNGTRLSVLLNIPVSERATAFVMASAYRVKAKFATLSNVVDVQPGPPVVVTPISSSASSSSSTHTLPGLGAGIEFAFTKSFSARASFERIDPKSGMFGPGNDVDKIDVRTVEFVFSF